jgi:hypothetical protein
MEVLTKVTVIFTLALALSLLIERFMEVIKSLYDLLDSRNDWYKCWDEKTGRLRDKFEKRLKVFEYVDTEIAARILHRVRGMLLKEQDQNLSNAPILSGDLVRRFYIKIILKLVGIATGIGLAFWFNIDLLKIWQDAAVDSSLLKINLHSEPVRVALTGIALGLGSGPVHKVITTIERRREKQKQKGGQE